MTIDRINTSLTILIIVVAGIAVLALGYSVSVVVSPFVLLAAILFLLYPFRENFLARRLMWLSLAMFLLWLLHSLSGILAPFILALILAYIFNPVVTRLERKRWPRWAASLVVTMVMLGLVVAAVLFIIPSALRQFNALIGAVNELAKNAIEIVKSGKVFDVLAEYGIPVEQARRIISEDLSPKLENILGELFRAVFGFVTGFSSVVLQIINIIIIPFLFFYLLTDLHRVKQAFISALPETSREKTTKVLQTIDELLGQYLRGAIVVALIQGTISTIVLALLGVNYPLVLGIMTAVLNFIPYVGLITSLVVACIVAMFSGDPVLAKVIGVIILYLSQKLLEATVFGPKIVGAKVGLHPVLLILSLLVFGYFLGLVGMLIAVPATALMIASYTQWQSARNQPAPAMEPEGL